MSSNDSDTEESQFTSEQDETFTESYGIPPLKRFQRLKPSTPKEHYRIDPHSENYKIIKEFQDLADWYASEPRERFRAQAYRKIMNVLLDYPTKITSGDQLKDIPGIGARTVKKIQDILDDKPDRLAMHVPEYVVACKEFQRVRGVGPKKARDLYDRGCRTLKDIRPHLTFIQQVYLDHLNDLEVPIDEEELIKIFERAKECAEKQDVKVKCELVGSYRRKSKFYFDVDILIYPTSKEKLEDGFLNQVLKRLDGFIVEKLAHSRPGKPQSFKGICSLGPRNLKRKLDIFTCEKSEVGAALLQWTGDLEYIRALKLYAKRKGMLFSQHGFIT
jgi:DNA polymerase/3'-5' exonuclease PolX